MVPIHSPCEETTLAVENCVLANGIFSNHCERDQLREKRCFAELFCRYEARRFYEDEIRGTSASCSTLLETFAFPENEMLVPHEISTEKKVRRECREIAYKLLECMSKRKANRLDFRKGGVGWLCPPLAQIVHRGNASDDSQVLVPDFLKVVLFLLFNFSCSGIDPSNHECLQSYPRHLRFKTQRGANINIVESRPHVGF